MRRRNLGYRFQRSYTIQGLIADFRSHERRPVVEVHGGQPAYNLAYDERRTAKMGDDAYRVIQFWNTEVLSNIDGMLEAIDSALEKDPAPHRSPPPWHRMGTQPPRAAPVVNPQNVESPRPLTQPAASPVTPRPGRTL